MAHKQAKKPFDVALKKLMEEKQISYVRLSERTKSLDPLGKGLSHTFIHELTSGKKTPRPERIELIARALGVNPEHFKEYRRYVVAQRAELLADEIGLPEVLAALDALEARQHDSNTPADD